MGDNKTSDSQQLGFKQLDSKQLDSKKSGSKQANLKSTNFDIIIVGGGMIGATAALALSQISYPHPLKIAIVESVEPSDETSSSFDQRAVALSAASVEILKNLKLWKSIQPLACAITDIHVSDQGRFGFTRLKANDYKMDALGQVVPLDQTGPVLWNAIRTTKNITTFCPYKITGIINKKDHKEVSVNIESEIDRSQQLFAKMLLAADGTFSSIAKMTNIKTSRKPYLQHAIIANIATEHPHKNRAFERFTQQGPLALLPLTRNRMSLVWCQTEVNAQKVLTYLDNEIIEKLQQEFGYRLGLITKIGALTTYPLALHTAEKTYQERVLLLGNAAHTLHPIAGQGFNLGLRDIAALVDHIKERPINEMGSESFFEDYQQQRQADWKQTITATNGLVKLFSNDFLPMAIARSKALGLVDKIPFVKKQLAMAAMGFSGKSAQLTRGKNI
jgi:2-octaprenyl-6-methoxyphenol hydroxylase